MNFLISKGMESFKREAEQNKLQEKQASNVKVSSKK